MRPRPEERVLSERALNRALLARQHLLERVAGPLSRAIERVGGLQTQYAPAGYIALRSRMEDFERDDLTRALERKQVVQAWMMRSTIHMASRRDFWSFVTAVRRARRDGWSRAWKRTAADGVEAAARVERFLADGPRRRAEIVKELGLDSGMWYGACLWVDLVRVPPSGTWERPRADLFGLARDWLGEPPDLSEVRAVAHLVRRYIGAFGPAAPADIASWSGLAPTTVTAALGAMRLRRFRDERGGELVDLPRAPLPDPETPAPVRFLGVWDAMLLAHARRTQVLPDRHRSRVFNTKTPQSVNTFLVDGRVAGSWRHEDGRIALDPFERLSRGDRRALDEEAAFMTVLYEDA
ncbi:MAG TPA: winged helix DNA-binding domain-containing protein [Actinomycetota bacterium]|nr:winged helix DNA-binding domain-containing protein [Actinomycetota bacterium]